MRQKKPERSKQTKPVKHFHRAVHIKDEIWSYKVGRGGIRIKSPLGRIHDIDLSTFSGLSWDDLERADWKGYGFEVTPQLVKDYIVKKRLKADL